MGRNRRVLVAPRLRGQGSVRMGCKEDPEALTCKHCLPCPLGGTAHTVPSGGRLGKGLRYRGLPGIRESPTKQVEIIEAMLLCSHDLQPWRAGGTAPQESACTRESPLRRYGHHIFRSLPSGAARQRGCCSACPLGGWARRCLGIHRTPRVLAAQGEVNHIPPNSTLHPLLLLLLPALLLVLVKV